METEVGYEVVARTGDVGDAVEKEVFTFLERVETLGGAQAGRAPSVDCSQWVYELRVRGSLRLS